MNENESKSKRLVEYIQRNITLHAELQQVAEQRDKAYLEEARKTLVGKCFRLWSHCGWMVKVDKVYDVTYNESLRLFNVNVGGVCLVPLSNKGFELKYKILPGVYDNKDFRVQIALNADMEFTTESDEFITREEFDEAQAYGMRVEPAFGDRFGETLEKHDVVCYKDDHGDLNKGTVLKFDEETLKFGILAEADPFKDFEYAWRLGNEIVRINTK